MPQLSWKTKNLHSAGANCFVFETPKNIYVIYSCNFYILYIILKKKLFFIKHARSEFKITEKNLKKSILQLLQLWISSENICVLLRVLTSEKRVKTLFAIISYFLCDLNFTIICFLCTLEILQLNT